MEVRVLNEEGFIIPKRILKLWPSAYIKGNKAHKSEVQGFGNKTLKMQK